MSDEPQQAVQTPSTPEATPAEPASSPAPSGPQTPTLEHRFSDADAPYPWAVGKTVNEVMDMTQGAFQTMQTFTPTVQNPQPPAVPQQPALQSAIPGMPDAQLSFDNPAEYNRQLALYMKATTDAAVQQQAAQFAQPMMQQQKQMARTLASQNPNLKDIFDKYGHEIDTQMLSVDPQYCTVDAYTKVAQMIKGQHLDEFIDAAVQKRAQIGSGTISGDAPSGPTESTVPQDAIDEFWESGHNYVKRLESDGITKNKLRENLPKMGLTAEAYIESIKRGNTISTMGGAMTETRNLILKG